MRRAAGGEAWGWGRLPGVARRLWALLGDSWSL